MIDRIRFRYKLVFKCMIDFYEQIFISRIFHRYGIGSLGATKKLIKNIKRIDPDIIYIHDIYEYFINI